MNTSVLSEYYTLSNGVRIPRLGLGTWLIYDDIAAEAVRNAVRTGYTLIDSAEDYGNERGVGEGVRTSGVPRENLFVTSKVDCHVKDHDSAVAAIEETLSKLDIGYLDLLLIHSPQPWECFRGENHFFKENIEVWKVMEDYYRRGKVRAIGVSNFLKADLENIIRNCEIRPMVNQIKVFPGNTPRRLIDYCQSQGILVESYSPLGHGQMMESRVVGALAGKYRVSIAQLCIRYCIQLGTVALPKTTDPAHMLNNAQLDFEIDKDDMNLLRNLNREEEY